MTGYWHKIEWGSPYSEPPAGAPRVLAETYTDTVTGRKMLPATTLGGGYSVVAAGGARCLRNFSMLGANHAESAISVVRR
jgi:hypothetical protein